MDRKIIDSMFYGNINYFDEGSFEVHTIQKNSTYIPDSCGFNINIGTNIVPMNNYSIQKPIKKDNIKCLKSWYITKKKTLVSTELLKIRGNLYDHKNNTTSREIHDAGFIKKIIKKNLIKTTNGKYHIISPPAEPKTKINEKFYTFWMITGGFPQKFNDL
ncbi:uncharacterized protein LOC126549130 isoform X2 [Aphis gossypii]|uniref:uncharacterized protein LOC126549130 isoform X2 n=1 Tax=Aphis gossypii TaxID=80765 RepID=UPI002158CB60|nr:uncharacterized protein LOC126549130 isoform X2 [Aphis gossypii]